MEPGALESNHSVALLESEVDRFLRKILKFGGSTDIFEFLHIRIWVFMI
jgi:hypothetical protein